MPKIGKKKKLLRDLDNVFLSKLSEHNLNIPDDPQVIQDATMEYLIHTEIVKSCRYAADRVHIEKTNVWIDHILPSLRGTRFRQQLRMNQATFKFMVSLVEENPVFRANNQADLELQLATTFFRFGRSGNGCSVMDVASRFGVSEGSVLNYTDNVIKALLSMRPEYIKWPDANEMRCLSNRMEKRGFPGCTGLIDGTPVPFYDKPLDCPEDYYSRKQEYAMQVQVTVDDNKKIIHLYTGMPASVHDSTVFRRSNITLPDSKYLLGDSAYPNSEFVITPFRKRIGTRPTKERAFNTQHSSVRVAVEHSIGILKSRFQSLKGLRIRVDKKEGHRRACEWITACCVLYNIIHECDPWEQMDQPEDEEAEDQQAGDRTGAGRRDLLMENIWQLKASGQI